MSAKFLISVLALDGLDITKRCLDSVLSNSEDYELLLTDNGSTDGTADYFDALAASRPNITVIHNKENEGFHGPNCHAFEVAKRRGNQILVLLNNDTEVCPKWLQMLAEPLDKIEKAALSGPLGGCSGLNSQMDGDTDVRREYVEGSCLAIKVSIVSQFGALFSPYLHFIYSEDADLSLRMQRAGYSIHHVGFRVKHLRSATTNRHPKARERCRQANIANRKVMMKKWAHWNRFRRFDYPIVVRRRFAIGDVLLATPIIRALKEQNPLCPIDVETDCPQIFHRNPNVRYAARRIGVQPQARHIVLDMAYERAPQGHVLDAYAEVADVELKPEDRRCDFFPSADDCRWADDITKERRNIVAIHPGPTTWPSKNWPLSHWLTVISHLQERGYLVALFHRQKFPNTITVAPDCTLHQMGALFSKCALMLGLCSAPAHIAQAMKTPIITLHGPTLPECFFQTTSPHIGITADRESYPEIGIRNRVANQTLVQCSTKPIEAIAPKMVIEAIEQMLPSPVAK